MFGGVTPPIVLSYFQKVLKNKGPIERLWCPFGGKFSIERMACFLDNVKEIHSSDVTVYSVGLGLGLAYPDQPSRFKLSEPMAERFPFIAEKIQENARSAGACIIVLAPVLNRGKVETENRFDMRNKRLLEIHEEKWFNIATQKMDKVRDALTSNGREYHFHAEDGVKIVDNAQPGDMVWLAPPIGNGTYETMTQRMEAAIIWEGVEYTVWHPQMEWALMNDLHKKGCLVYDERYKPEDKEQLDPRFFVGMRYEKRLGYAYSVVTNDPDVPIYAGQADNVREIPMAFNVIDIDQVITSNTKIRIMEANKRYVNHYRLMWLYKAQPSNAKGGTGFLITADGNIIGLLLLHPGKYVNREWLALYSDTAPMTSKYKRLSKLVLMLINTKEFMDMMKETFFQEYTGLTTIALSNNPVSMKYRNVMELIKRDEDFETEFKYGLVYRTKSLRKDYQTALNEWLKKDGKYVKE